MDGFSDRLDDLYRSFSSLGSREQRERAVEELSVALQRMSATLDSPSDVLAEEATRIIAAEYGMGGWDAPSTSYGAAMMDSPYDPAHEMYEYSEALREEAEGEGGAGSLLNYWKENSFEDDDITVPPSSVGGTEEERRKRHAERRENGKEGATQEKRIKLDRVSLEEEEVDGEVEMIGCVICADVLDSFDAYLSHMQSSHVERDGDENEDEKMEEEKKREWKCAECDYVAGSRKTLWRHGRSSGHDWTKRGETDYSCDHCDYEAGSKFNLERHRLRNHAEPLELDCPLCFAVLPSIPSFLAHHDAVHREKSQRFQCELCAKEFTRKDKVIRHHKVVHESLREFPCPTCPSSFPSGWHLRRHLKSERGCKGASH